MVFLGVQKLDELFVVGESDGYLLSTLGGKHEHALLPEKAANFVRDTAKLTAHTFSNYISGRILDSVIVGILCFIGMTILGISHAALISFMVGVTNFIPMIGPALGIIPSALIFFW